MTVEVIVVVGAGSTVLTGVASAGACNRQQCTSSDEQMRKVHTTLLGQSEDNPSRSLPPLKISTGRERLIRSST